MVGTSVNGIFEAVLLAEEVGDCLEFGKYFKIRSEINESGKNRDAECI